MKKSVASIPANYVSILQLQERWMRDKEQKQKEREIVERGVEQQVKSRDEDGGDSRERKKKGSKKKVKKKNQGVSVEETRGEKTVQNIDNDASYPIGVETQSQLRVEENGRDREVNVDMRLNSGLGYYRNQKHDWSSTRVIKATRTMVWVKKGENEAAGGVKHLGPKPSH